MEFRTFLKANFEKVLNTSFEKYRKCNFQKCRKSGDKPLPLNHYPHTHCFPSNSLTLSSHQYKNKILNVHSTYFHLEENRNFFNCKQWKNKMYSVYIYTCFPSYIMQTEPTHRKHIVNYVKKVKFSLFNYIFSLRLIET